MPGRTRSLHILRLALLTMVVALGHPLSATAQTLAGDLPGPEDAAETRKETFEASLAKARIGDAKAQCEVGVAYLNGDQVAQDFRQGLAWLMQSSDRGFGYARYVLADVYSRGYAGVPVSDADAYYYASLAAASSSLSEKYRQRAVKLRNACAKRLTPVQTAAIQARTALAPLDAAGVSRTGW